MRDEIVVMRTSEFERGRCSVLVELMIFGSCDSEARCDKISKYSKRSE